MRIAIEIMAWAILPAEAQLAAWHRRRASQSRLRLILRLSGLSEYHLRKRRAIDPGGEQSAGGIQLCVARSNAPTAIIARKSFIVGILRNRHGSIGPLWDSP